MNKPKDDQMYVFASIVRCREIPGAAADSVDTTRLLL
jgi:hypothetical protein